MGYIVLTIINLNFNDFLFPSFIVVSSSLVNSNEKSREIVKFFLYTRNNPNEALELNKNNLVQLDGRHRVKMVVHGWMSSAEEKWINDMTAEYLKNDWYNVILVDWSKIASEPYYIAALSTSMIGTTIGDFIVTLKRNYGVPLTKFHLIGHSLGAHIVGKAGKEVFDLTGLKISRISALDAAAPLFENQAPLPHEVLERIQPSLFVEKLQLVVYENLKRTDADIVDVIHTDACELGLAKPLGTVDFYPNGGTPLQPGCQPCFTKPRMYDLLHVHTILHCISCSHMTSTTYFIKSINNQKFISTKCNSWNRYKSGNCSNHFKVLMGDGYIYSPKATGKFYLRTN